MSKGDKFVAATISLEGEVLVWFQWERRSSFGTKLDGVQSSIPRLFWPNAKRNTV